MVLRPVYKLIILIKHLTTFSKVYRMFRTQFLNAMYDQLKITLSINQEQQQSVVGHPQKKYSGKNKY